MRRGLFLLAASLALLAAFVAGRRAGTASPASSLAYHVQQDGEVATQQPGTHNGGGWTTAYPFFEDVPDVPFVFRKRALHPGSAIGYHPHGQDEIYYVLSGSGEMTLDGRQTMVGPGTAILIRDGSSHGLRQVGDEDLVILIVYPR
jgi:mannose-6-phosphate isomerase-like protein (cupin superfamily)